MHRSLGQSAAAVLVVVLAVVLVVGAWLVTRGGDARDPITSAVSVAPAGSRSVAVTVWSRLPNSTDRAALSDLTSVSIVSEFSDELDELLGWRPSDLSWEAAIVTPAGQAVVLGLGSLDADAVDDGLEQIGDRDGDSWLISRASNSFIVNFTHIRVVRSAGVLIASAQPEALDEVVATVRGWQPSLMTDRGVATLTQAAAGRASALFQGGPKLCSNPDSGLDVDEVAALRQVEARHGALTNPTWLMRALGTSPRRYVFGTAFADADTARSQLDVRQVLTSGSFLGRYGKVEDALTDLRSAVDGSTVTFDFAPADRPEPYMTNSGPVIFAGCSVP